MKTLLIFLLVIVTFSVSAQTDSFLLLSDIHLNLSTKHQEQFYHEDSDTELFESAVNSFNKRKVAYLIMPGDLLFHQDSHSQESMILTYSYIKNQLKTFTIIPAMGNNDLMERYKPNPNDYKVFYDVFLKELDRNGSIWKTFKNGGFYTYNKGRLTIIVLNTVLFDRKCNSCEIEADSELTWLGKELHKDSLKKVWLVYHIPPGVNRYDGELFMRDTYQEKFVDTIKKYASIIKLQLAGHTHMDDFRLIMDNKDKMVSYVHIVPGLDAAHGNNPAYQVIQYFDSSGSPIQIETYYRDSNNKVEWSNYSFNDFDFDFLKRYDSSNSSWKQFMQTFYTNRTTDIQQKSKLNLDGKTVVEQSQIK